MDVRTERLERSYARASLFTGVIIGIFIVFSTLGVNSVAATVYFVGDESSPENLILVNIIWVVVATTLAALFLKLLLSVRKVGSDTSRPECRFVAGGILGVATSCIAVDAVFGISDVPFWIILASLFCILMLLVEPRERKKKPQPPILEV